MNAACDGAYGTSSAALPAVIGGHPTHPAERPEAFHDPASALSLHNLTIVNIDLGQSS
jgi:hypothetical protein